MHLFPSGLGVRIPRAATDALGAGGLDQRRQVLDAASGLVDGAALDREEQLTVLVGMDLEDPRGSTDPSLQQGVMRAV